MNAPEWISAPAVRRQPGEELTVCVTGLSSDAHTWNLVYVQLLVEDLGHRVHNLGPCVPDSEIIERCRTTRPDLLVISTVNGHGFHSAPALVAALRSDRTLRDLPVVIGGKLGVSEDGAEDRTRALLAAGCSAVFAEGEAGLASFVSFLGNLPARSRRAAA
ncbi:cobalamin B12-binding domain-containing protein [Streptomyces sp. NPDC050732]|uniref:cobalamin B12-binding domain-containing protein n=1 Tax=Streptomyces sp. NPDC050732 TaxID=3154632 RepID=UPI00341BA2F0